VRRLLLIAAAAAAVVYAALPPRAAPLPAPGVRLAAPVRGVFHVHSRRSDGSGTPEQIARAAASAGLRFIVMTDHGDATRAADAPAYYAGVLVIDAVEISTDGGHVVALALPRSPYPLGGEARDALEDIRRMGGFAIAAHPTSTKEELRWRDWSLPIDGLEHLNGDSEWRDENAFALLRALIAYPFRPAETMARLFDRSDEAFRHWDALLRMRRVIGLVGADAHGRLALRGQDPYRGRLALPAPGYGPVFRSASIALPGIHLTSDAAVDAAAILGAIRAGRAFSSVDALAARPSFELAAASGRLRAAAGEVLPLDGPLRIDIAVQAPTDARIVLLRDGVQVLDAAPPSARYDAEQPVPGAYRVEVRLRGASGDPPVPWLVSNPIYVGRHFVPVEPPVFASPAAAARTDVYVDGPASSWNVEHAETSRAALDVIRTETGTQLLMRYALSGTVASHPFTALVTPAGPIAGHATLAFRAQSDRPMRLSVQLRADSGTPEGERWHRSVFIGTDPRAVRIQFDDMRPSGQTRTRQPRLQDVRSLLFVVDTVNTSPGMAGQLSIDEVRYER
jgi:hypothetical protein